MTNYRLLFPNPMVDSFPTRRDNMTALGLEMSKPNYLWRVAGLEHNGLW